MTDVSMISALIDELNKSADEWNNSNMFELARMCREAADTIWQLRDDLQRAHDAVRDAEHDESRAWDRVRKAEAESEKLRELVREMWPHVRHRSRMCAECELPCGKSHECLLYEPMRERMRELGIEVEVSE